jgi:hypothetical protein
MAKDDLTVIICGAQGVSMIKGTRWRRYAPVAGAGRSVLVTEGDVRNGNFRQSWLEGTFPASYCWSAAIIGRFMVLGTSKGLVALEFGNGTLK